MFSVVIPTCRGGPLLSRCIESLVRFGPECLQIIVVMDGPIQIETVLPKDLPGNITLEIVALPVSKGFCHAVNRGLERATNPIVQMLNDDAFVLSGWYNDPVTAFGDPDTGAVAPLVLMDTPQQQTVDSAGDSMNPLGIIRNRHRGRNRDVVENRPTEVFSCGACAGFFRLGALKKAGGFPEDLSAYFDDVDVSMALRRMGYRIWFVPTSVAIHSGGQSYGTVRGQLLTQQSRNEELVFWRNMPIPLLFFMAIPRFWLVFLKGVVHLKRGTFRAWLLGKWQVLISLFRWNNRSHQIPSLPVNGNSKRRKRNWPNWPWLV